MFPTIRGQMLRDFIVLRSGEDGRVESIILSRIWKERTVIACARLKEHHMLWWSSSRAWVYERHGLAR